VDQCVADVRNNFIRVAAMNADEPEGLQITEVITHLAFCAGWPSAMSAAQLAYTVLVENQKPE